MRYLTSYCVVIVMAFVGITALYREIAPLTTAIGDLVKNAFIG